MKPHINTIQTAVGTLDLIYSDGDLEVKLNGQTIQIPYAWSKQTNQTIVRKVCNMIKMGQMKDLSQYDDEVA